MKVDCPPGETLSGKSARAVPCVVFVIMKGRQLVNGSEGVLNAEWVCTLSLVHVKATQCGLCI